MFRRVEIVGTGIHDTRDGPGAAGIPEEDAGTPVPLAWPDLSGDVERLLGSRPCFRVRARGYDRLQVDNYVAWAEWEIVTARREADHLLSRFGTCSAELEISRRLLAETPKGREVGTVSERVGEILRLAAEEATHMTDAAGIEADEFLAEARMEADARLRKAHSIKEMAVASGDALREQARRDREAATAALDQARIDADELLRCAQADRERLVADAAQLQEQADAAVQQLSAVQAELADLHRQRDEAQAALRGLIDQLGQVLQLVGPAALAAAAGRTESGVLAPTS
jgi:cell division septum initiation protein DivIVA